MTVEKRERAFTDHRVLYAPQAKLIMDTVKRILSDYDLKAEFEKDRHMNGIPLERWDGIAFLTKGRVAAALEDGECWSLSKGVCAAKEAARLLVEGGVEDGINKEAG